MLQMSQNYPGRRSFAQDPAEGAYSAPPDRLTGGEGVQTPTQNSIPCGARTVAPKHIPCMSQ